MNKILFLFLSLLIIPTTSLKGVLDEIIFGVVPTALATGFTGATYLTANALNLDEQTVKAVTGTALIAGSGVVFHSILVFTRWNREVSKQNIGPFLGSLNDLMDGAPGYLRPIFSLIKLWCFAKAALKQPSELFK